MDQARQVSPALQGSYSGNTGNNNIVGSHNTTLVLPGVTNLGAGSQSGVLGAGDGASRPYRIIPYARNSMFAGRKDLLGSVKRVCESEGHSRVALFGLGGSGKTQIALEYVYQSTSRSDCDVFWVQGSGALKFSEGFKALAEHVRIPSASPETDEEEFLLGVRRWFEGPDSGDWILVIDNADNEADFLANNSPIAKFIPQGTKGTLVITTRSRQVASRQGCTMIEVGNMGQEEAVELFSKRFSSWDNLEDGEKEVVPVIVESLQHLPLAIAGSAAFMTETVTPPSVYYTIFRGNEERMKKLLSQQFSDIQRETDVTESVLGTFFVTFDRIQQQMPTAADLLRLMAFFDCQNIPEALLTQCGLEGMDDSVDFRVTMGKLLGFSLVTVVKHEDKTLYELHRLVQLSLQVYLPAAELNQWKATALGVVSRLFPRDRDKARYIGPAYITHALAVTKDIKDPIAEDLCHRMGWYLLDIGSYRYAEIQVRRCISLREEGKGYDWDNNGHMRFLLLGVVKASLGEYKESETINRRVLEECEGILGPDHPSTLTSLNNLAIVLRGQGKYEESEAIDRRALEMRENVLGSYHPDTLTSLDNLAIALRRQGKYEESEAEHRRALEMRERVLGSYHPSTLISLNNLAIVLRRQGKYEESEAMHRRELEGSEKVLGSNHPDILTSLNNLAIVLSAQGKYKESEAIHRRELEESEKVLGPDHPSTLTSFSNLAGVLSDQGNYEESEAMHRRELEGSEKVLGANHPSTLISLNNLATVLCKQGKYEESEAMHRRTLEMRQKVLRSNHPDTLASVDNLALVLSGQGKYEESEAMHRRALEMREKVLGSNHPDTLTSLNNLALVLSGQGKYQESETMYQRALKGRIKVLGHDHPDTLATVHSLAVVLGDQAKPHARSGLRWVHPGCSLGWVGFVGLCSPLSFLGLGRVEKGRILGSQ